MVDSGGQYQVVIGNEVQTAFKEIQRKWELQLKGPSSDNQESIISRLISVISTTFTPMIPANRCRDGKSHFGRLDFDWCTIRQ